MKYTIPVKFTTDTGIDSATVANVLVSPGAKVNSEESILLLKNGEISIPVRPHFPGMIKSVEVHTGNIVTVDDILLTMEVEQKEEISDIKITSQSNYPGSETKQDGAGFPTYDNRRTGNRQSLDIRYQGNRSTMDSEMNHKTEKETPPSRDEDKADKVQFSRGIEFRAAYTEGEDEVLKFFMLVDQRGLPDKLGDGMFGIVFRGEDPRGNECAIKILYDRSYHQQKLSSERADILVLEKTRYESGLDRFKQEKDAMRLILEALKSRESRKAAIRRVGKISTIVELIGSTDNFPSTELQQCFERQQQQIELSSYALVTELYEGTLKELLETANQERPKTGYTLLKELDFSCRTETILPFLDDLVDGLATMHRAGYLHLDVKPANVFWRNEGNRSFSTALGDLGYIRKFTEKTVRNELETALGTRHYRSPEQFNFKDFAEVKVVTVNKETMTLVTDDPKFLNTVMEKGDVLRFFKKLDNEYPITDISADKTEHKTRIIIENHLKENIVEQGEITQIEIYKSQGIKTDLCGFGGILYDLITCGKSPEQFFRFLSAFDSEDNSVSEVMARYGDIISNHSGVDPSISTAFQVFFDQEFKYTPPQVVKIILKCVLYRARGTYYDLSKSLDNGPSGAMDLVVDDVAQLSEYWKGGIRNRFENILFTDQKKEEVDIVTVTGLREYVNSVQMQDKDELQERIIAAAFIFTKLIQLLRDKVADDDSFFFAECGPDNINVLNHEKLEFKAVIYQNQQEFIDDLRFNINKIKYKASNPFSPPEADLARSIAIRSVASASGDGGGKYRYRFLDASDYFDDCVRVGDLVLVGEGRDKIQQIIEADRDYLILAPLESSFANEASQEYGGDLPDGRKTSVQQNVNSADHPDQTLVVNRDRQDGSLQYTYYRRPDPNSCFLSVLGEYVYQLFFVGMASNTISKPAAVCSLQAQLRASPSLQPDVSQAILAALETKAFRQNGAPGAVLSSLYRRLTAFYLALTVQDLRSVLGDKPLHNLNDKWIDVADDIAQCLGKSKGSFHDPLDFRKFASGLADPGRRESGNGESQQTTTAADAIEAELNLVEQLRALLKTSWA